MTDFPKTQLEFERWFQTEEACVEYLTGFRWPEGVLCPRCHGTNFWKYGTTWKCAGCRTNLRVLAGTLFQDTHLPLTTWFRAMWHVVSQKYGTSALGLKRVLDLSYPTTWNLLHKLRRAMIRAGREALTGVVEVDETYYGGEAEGKPGRGSDKKALIVVAVEVYGKTLGRVRMKVIPTASAKELLDFVRENIEKSSAVITDGWSGYAQLTKNGYSHTVKKVSKDREALPNVHRVISLLKRWLFGTLQGAVSHKNLGFYLDEYAFRFNRRKSASRGKLFKRLMEQAVQLQPIKWSEIAGQTASPKTDHHDPDK